MKNDIYNNAKQVLKSEAKECKRQYANDKPMGNIWAKLHGNN